MALHRRAQTFTFSAGPWLHCVSQQLPLTLGGSIAIAVSVCDFDFAAPGRIGYRPACQSGLSFDFAEAMSAGGSEDSFVMEDIAYEVQCCCTNSLRSCQLSDLTSRLPGTGNEWLLKQQIVMASLCAAFACWLQDNDFEEDVQTALVHADKVQPS